MKKLFKDIGLAGLTDVVRILRSLIMVPILTRAVGAAGYGMLTQIRVSIIFIMPFLALGLGNSVVRFLSGEKNKVIIRDSFLSSVICVASISFIAASGFYLLSAPLARFILGDEKLFYLIRVAAVLLFLYPVDYMMVVYLRTFRQMKKHFTFLTLEVMSEVSLIAICLFMKLGLTGILFAMILSKALFLAARSVNILSQTGVAIPKWDRLKDLVTFGFPLVLAGSFYLLINYGDRFVIRYFLGIDKVGIYSVGYIVGTLIIVLMTPFEYVLYPKMVSLWNNDQMDEFKLYIKKILGICIFIAVAACLVLITFAKDIVILISNEAFKDAAVVIPYVSLGFLAFGIGIIGERIITLLNKTRLVTYIYGVLGSLNILLNIIFVPRMGIQGAALATLVTFSLYLLITFSISYRYIV